jgi:hypothetical protein
MQLLLLLLLIDPGQKISRYCPIKKFFETNKFLLTPDKTIVFGCKFLPTQAIVSDSIGHIPIPILSL